MTKIKLLDLDEYKKIQKECLITTKKKNKDYGCDTMLKFNEEGIVVRMYDKMERLINLVNNKQTAKVKDESIEDTAKDMINYATYLVMMKRGKLVGKKKW